MKLVAELVAKQTVKQAALPSNQVLALPTGKPTGKRYCYTEYSGVYRLIDPKNPSLGFILQTSGSYAGRPKAFGFRKQNRKEIVITWPNGAEVRFMKTQDSPKVHDSRTPTMSYDQAHVLSELKRVIGDDTKALEQTAWLMNVMVFDKETKNPETLYGKCKVAGFETYRQKYGKKAKQPRATIAPVAPSVPLSQEVEGDIPF